MGGNNPAPSHTQVRVNSGKKQQVYTNNSTPSRIPNPNELSMNGYAELKNELHLTNSMNSSNNNSNNSNNNPNNRKAIALLSGKSQSMRRVFDGDESDNITIADVGAPSGENSLNMPKISNSKEENSNNRFMNGNGNNSGIGYRSREIPTAYSNYGNTLLSNTTPIMSNDSILYGNLGGAHGSAIPSHYSDSIVSSPINMRPGNNIKRPVSVGADGFHASFGPNAQHGPHHPHMPNTQQQQQHHQQQQLNAALANKNAMPQIYNSIMSNNSNPNSLRGNQNMGNGNLFTLNGHSAANSHHSSNY